MNNTKLLTETIPAWPLVVAAYGFVWLAVLAFVAWTFAKLHRLQSQVRALENSTP